jgi:hypothetical protein
MKRRSQLSCKIGFRNRFQDSRARKDSCLERGFKRAGKSAGALRYFSKSGLPAVLPLILLAAIPLAGRGKDKISYGEGLIINVPFPVSQVEQVVQDVAQNGIIRGTKEYNKDEYVGGAQAASSSHVFGAWTEGGKVYYKVRENAIDPRNFKDSGDVGTLVVRYVIQPQGDKNTVLRIDALFKETFRRTVHQSDGSVESAEYKDIHDHLESIELMKQQTLEAQQERQEQLKKKKQNSDMKFDVGSEESSSSSSRPAVTPPAELQASAAPAAAPQPGAAKAEESAAALPQPEATQPSPSQPSPQPEAQIPVTVKPGQSLEDHVKELRKQIERVVKAPGAPLKSAPFHTASTLQSLPTGTEILIVISTPYWYGVETHEGQHGWMMRDDLEQP